jgi:kumamolisin
MSEAQEYARLTGSERGLVPQAQDLGPAEPEHDITATVVLAPAAGATDDGTFTSEDPARRRYLSRQELAERRGASEESVAELRRFAEEHGLRLGGVDLARRTVEVSGTVAQFNAAFRTDLRRFQLPGETFRSRVGPLHVPASLEPSVEAVVGLTDRIQARTRYRRHEPQAAAAAGTSFTPPEVARLYGFPTGLTGAGQCVGILELDTPVDPNDPNSPSGAGYSTADLDAYFAGLGIDPPPEVIAVPVDGGSNSPGVNPDVDVEVVLDIEVIGAVAPGVTIVVYFAPNTDQGFVDAIKAAVHDDVHRPSVFSISWGAAEEEWSAMTRAAVDSALQDAAAVGMTVLAASGDDGSRDGVADGRVHTDYPASSPWAVGCGGTRITVENGAIRHEEVWNDASSGHGAGGGGISKAYQRPRYQQHVTVPPDADDHTRGRGVPDVSGNASPLSGYRIRLNGGQSAVVGGTSAVAPLYSALVALADEAVEVPLGFLLPIAYSPARSLLFHDIRTGNNRVDPQLKGYDAGHGWDPCSGLGRFDGTRLLATLGARAAPEPV